MRCVLCSSAIHQNTNTNVQQINQISESSSDSSSTSSSSSSSSSTPLHQVISLLTSFRGKEVLLFQRSRYFCLHFLLLSDGCGIAYTRGSSCRSPVLISAPNRVYDTIYLRASARCYRFFRWRSSRVAALVLVRVRCRSCNS